MENPDGPDNVHLEDMPDERGDVIQPIGEADLPGHVSWAEVPINSYPSVDNESEDEKIETDCPANDQQRSTFLSILCLYIR